MQNQLGFVADPAIKAIARLEFEDGLRMGVLPRGCWYPCDGRTLPRINSKLPLECRLLLGAVWLSSGPLSEQIQDLQSSMH